MKGNNTKTYMLSSLRLLSKEGQLAHRIHAMTIVNMPILERGPPFHGPAPICKSDKSGSSAEGHLV